MRKFRAVLKREYIQRVRARMFIVSTILLPVVISLFGIVPAVILSIDAGGPMRVAVIDQTGKVYGRLADMGRGARPIRLVNINPWLVNYLPRAI